MEGVDRSALALVLDSVVRCMAAQGGSIDDRRADVLGAGCLATAIGTAGDDLALQVAAELPRGIFGAASYAIATAGTFMDAVIVGERYVRELMPGIQFQCRTLGERAELEVLWDVPEIGALAEELLLALAVRNGRALLSATVAPLSVKLRRPRPREPRPWVTMFGVLPSFGMPRSVIHFKAAALDTPLRTANPALHAIVSRRAAETLSVRVRRFLSVAPDDVSPQAVARTLGLPLRTLQRRLLDEGTSFRDLVAAVRIDRAKHLLVTTRFPIAEIAMLVGFHRATSFARAFKLVAGLSASEFRDRAPVRHGFRHVEC